MRLSGASIASKTRGRILSGDASSVLTGASIDSRSLKAGDLFFAITGAVHDGHRFVPAAVAAGAGALVVSDASAVAGLGANILVVLVDDTTKALQDLAAATRREDLTSVVAITGSVGKTTTKELTRLLLDGTTPTHASPGNLNNHYGLPLAILGVPTGVDSVVLELGISTPGEMDRLIEIAEPDFGLVTLISAVHVGNFASFDELCAEKMKLPRGSRHAFLNADDPEQVRRAAGVGSPITYFGASDLAAPGLRLLGIRSHGLLGSEVSVEEAGNRIELSCPLPGAHNARNLVAAAAVARGLGVEWDVIERQALRARPSKHRGEVHEIGGATIVDDCYNANPAAMRAALELLMEVEPRGGRRIFVAGDMLELGDVASTEHALLGTFAASRVDLLLGVGPESRQTVDAARAAGLSAEHVDDAAAAGHWLVTTLRAGDVALVKGSRGIALDQAIDHLLAARGPAAANGRAK